MTEKQTTLKDLNKKTDKGLSTTTSRMLISHIHATRRRLFGDCHHTGKQHNHFTTPIQTRWILFSHFIISALPYKIGLWNCSWHTYLRVALSAPSSCNAPAVLHGRMVSCWVSLHSKLAVHLLMVSALLVFGVMLVFPKTGRDQKWTPAMTREKFS